MKRIEFFAEPEGGIFKIPKEYQKDLQAGKIRVVLFIDEDLDEFEKISEKNIEKYSKDLEELAKK